MSPSRGLLCDCTTGCGTDGALHSTTCEAETEGSHDTLEVLPVLRMRGGGGEVVPAVQDRLLAERGEALPVGRHPGLGPRQHRAHGAATENKECRLLGNPFCTFFAHSTTILVSACSFIQKNN